MLLIPRRGFDGDAWAGYERSGFALVASLSTTNPKTNSVSSIPPRAQPRRPERTVRASM
jgi:hypothetical protein